MSTKQIKAQELFQSGKVNQVNPDTYVVHGSSNNQYEVKANHDSMYNYEYYCKCPAWKFDTTRECKHVLAVKLWLQNSSGYSKPQMVQQNGGSYKVTKKANGNANYKVRKAKKNSFEEIESKGSDGKNKPLRFDKDGKLIIQYSQAKQIQNDEGDEDEFD